MTSILMILIILACAVLGFFVLVQKPKGGGLSGTFGSIGTQVMGVKQSGDVMEKGTWYSMAIIVLLCIGSVFTLGQLQPREPEQQQEQQKQGQQGNQQQGNQQGAQQQPAAK